MSGKDATDKFWQFHSKKVLEKTAAPFLIGRIGGEEAGPKNVEEAVEGKVEQDVEAEEVDEDVYGDLVPFGGSSSPFLLFLLPSQAYLFFRLDPQWYQDWSSPYFNDSHRKVRSAIRKYTG
jgi:hypothetical protein